MAEVTVQRIDRTIILRCFEETKTRRTQYDFSHREYATAKAAELRQAISLGYGFANCKAILEGESLANLETYRRYCR